MDGYTLEFYNISFHASTYGLQGISDNEQVGSQNPLALHGFTKIGGPEKVGFGG